MTNPPSDILEALARRCEAENAPDDDDLDLAIATASYNLGFPIWGARVNYDPALWLERHGPIVRSLDAAMSLVPVGWGYSICPKSVLLTRSASDSGVMARAATPALALCAASLRALAAKDKGNE